MVTAVTMVTAKEVELTYTVMHIAKFRVMVCCHGNNIFTTVVNLVVYLFLSGVKSSCHFLYSSSHLAQICGHFS